LLHPISAHTPGSPDLSHAHTFATPHSSSNGVSAAPDIVPCTSSNAHIVPYANVPTTIHQVPISYAPTTISHAPINVYCTPANVPCAASIFPHAATHAPSPIAYVPHTASTCP
ncbi:hypothetical protein U1Q18_049295, partial [Sarracenia purpurea var. burkii]